MKSDEGAEGTEGGDANPLAALQEQFDNVSSAVGGAVEAVGSFAQGILPWAINQLRSYAELFAVMVMTSIVIPLLVPLVVYFMFKILFLSDSDVTVPASLVEALVSGGSRLSGAGASAGDCGRCERGHGSRCGAGDNGKHRGSGDGCCDCGDGYRDRGGLETRAGAARGRSCLT